MMGVEAAVSSNDFLNFIIYDTISAANPYFSTQHDHQSNHFNSLVEETLRVLPPPPPPPPLPLPYSQEIENFCGNHSFNNTRSSSTTGSSSAVLLRRLNSNNIGGGSGGGGKKKRRRKARVCKNKQEAETQRMTHIAVERNRRKQMNEHLAVLRSLMPDSYAQRGDQASIVGGAIEFVKEQEHLLQSLEAKKFQLLHGLVSTSSGCNHDHDHQSSPSSNDDDNNKLMMMMMDIPEPEPKPKPDSMMKAPFAQFFVYPQYTWCQSPNPMNKMYQGGGKSSSTRASIADIEVTLIETHANVRIMTRISRNQATTTRQLSTLVAGFQALHLTILHVNLTTISPLLVFYSISAKLEEGCQLTSVDDIAGAVHHMIGIIIEEDDICPAGFI